MSLTLPMSLTPEDWDAVFSGVSSAGVLLATYPALMGVKRSWPLLHFTGKNKPKTAAAAQLFGLVKNDLQEIAGQINPRELKMALVGGALIMIAAARDVLDAVLHFF